MKWIAGPRRGLCKATGHERHVLPNGDFSLFVVERKNIGGRKYVAFLARLERACECAEVQDFTDTGDIDSAAHDTEVETSVNRADVAGCADDIGTSTAKIGTTDHLRAIAIDTG